MFTLKIGKKVRLAGIFAVAMALMSVSLTRTAPQTTHKVATQKVRSQPALKLVASSVTDGIGIRLVAAHYARAAGFRYVHTGSYTNNGVVGFYCFNYLKALYAGQNTTLVRTNPLYAFAMNTWGGTTSGPTAAALSAAVHILQGDAKFIYDWNQSYVPQLKATAGWTGVPSLTSLMVNTTRNQYGLPAVSVVYLSTPSLGHSGAAIVTLRSTKTGKGIPNRPLRVTLVNAKAGTVLPTTTNSNGQARVNFIPTASSNVSVSAQANVVQWSTVIQTVPSATQQLLQHRSSTTSVWISGKATYTAQKVTLTQACTTTCAGIARVATNRLCNTTGNLRVVYHMRDNGVAKATLILGSGQCGVLAALIPDAHVSTVVSQILSGGKYTPAVLVATIRVDCPPLPAATVTVPCRCFGNAPVTVNFPANTSAHLQVVLISDGTTTTTISSNPGDAAKVVSFTALAGVQYTVTCGAYKADGKTLRSMKCSTFSQA